MNCNGLSLYEVTEQLAIRTQVSASFPVQEFLGLWVMYIQGSERKLASQQFEELQLVVPQCLQAEW